jgi:hypothetical protein
MYDVNKNSVIVPTADAAGITNTAYAGQTRLGKDFFTGEELADTNEVLSRRLVCDRCFKPPKTRADLFKQNGYLVCKECLYE